MKENDAIYRLKEDIPFQKAVPFGLQHVLAMFVANIAPILIVAGAVKMSPEESGALVQSAMIVAGVGSLLQMFPLWRLGSGLPIIMVSASPSCLWPASSVRSTATAPCWGLL